jgi:colicin import membrane protein
MAAAPMTPTSPSAFMLSVTLHGVAIALALMFGYAANRDIRNAPKILELVAGEGDNYAAREAPALGREGGVKLTVPEAPAPKPTPPAPVTPTPAPVTKAPAPVNDAIPDFKKKIQRAIIIGDSRAKLQIKKEREAEAKRLAEEKKRITKEEFDRAQKNKSSSTKVASAKVTPIDSEGIAKGVVGGSVNNKVGGAGGKALRSDNDDVLGAYYAMFKQRLQAKFEAPPGVSVTLKATLEVRSNLDGSLTNARIKITSGSKEFDLAVLDAVRAGQMPPRPPGRASDIIEVVVTPFDRDEG